MRVCASEGKCYIPMRNSDEVSDSALMLGALQLSLNAFSAACDGELSIPLAKTGHQHQVGFSFRNSGNRNIAVVVADAVTYQTLKVITAITTPNRFAIRILLFPLINVFSPCR